METGRCHKPGKSVTASRLLSLIGTPLGDLEVLVCTVSKMSCSTRERKLCRMMLALRRKRRGRYMCVVRACMWILV